MDIGKNLYDLRKKNGITQETLAFEMGVSVAAVSYGADGYVTKPFLPEHIQVVLKEVTGNV